MVQITLTGDTPSKKNSKQVRLIKGRVIFLTSSQHRKWHSLTLAQLYGIKPVVSQITSVELKFFPSTKRLFDLSNKTESIMDLLVDAGIIQDDNYSVVPKLILEIGEHDKLNPRCEITIH